MEILARIIVKTHKQIHILQNIASQNRIVYIVECGDTGVETLHFYINP